MSAAEQLAKLTAGTDWKIEPGTGGKPEITRELVCAALGYSTDSRIPADRVGVHLVLARHCLDSFSQGVLEPKVLEIAWLRWLRDKRSGAVSVALMGRLARLAIYDWCHTQRVREEGTQGMAEFIGVDPKTWRRKYRSHYGCVMDQLYRLESPVMKVLNRQLQ